MTDIDQSKANETKVDQPEGAASEVPIGFLFLGLFAFFLVGGLGGLLLLRGQEIAASTQVVVALSAVVTVVGTFVGAYFGVKASSEATKEIKRATDATDVYAQQLTKTEPGNILAVAAAQTELLTGYYRTVLAQARESFRWALVAAGIGLLFFLGAVAFLLIVHLQSVATASIISGALIEVISGINFYLYGKTTTQLATFHRRLDQTQRFLLANSVCESLEGAERQKARASLVHTIADPTLGQ